jgi:acyl dehydratase
MTQQFAAAKRFSSPDELEVHVGEEVFVSDWTRLTQDRINLFADATGDHQWIHVNPARAQAESPFGNTIAHGFFTLSILGQFYEEYLSNSMPFYDMGINYGLNRVRFTHPVIEGSRLRCRLRLEKVEKVVRGHQLTFNVTVEIEGEERPACVAESIVRRLSSVSPRVTS